MSHELGSQSFPTLPSLCHSLGRVPQWQGAWLGLFGGSGTSDLTVFSLSVSNSLCVQVLLV